MLYYGKTLDTFEPAMAQLMRFYHLPAFRHIDCAALRCFGFSADLSIKQWFSPLISLEAAVDSFSQVFEIPMLCQAVNMLDRATSLPAAGCLLGPVEIGVAARDISTQFYMGAEKFLTIRPLSNGKMEAFDPSGIPGAQISLEQVNKLLLSDRTFCIFPNIKSQHMPRTDDWVPSPRKIFQRGLQFHHSIMKQEQKNLEDADRRYVSNRSNSLSLRYSAVNAGLQMDKVYWVANDCAAPPQGLEFAYLDEKQRFYRSAEIEDMKLMNRSVSRMWEIMDEYGTYLGVV